MSHTVPYPFAKPKNLTRREIPSVWNCSPQALLACSISLKPMKGPIGVYPSQGSFLRLLNSSSACNLHTFVLYKPTWRGSVLGLASLKSCGSSGAPGQAQPGSQELAVPISFQPYIPDVTLLVCNRPRWEHLHHGNRQMLQTRSCATKASCPTYQHPLLPGSQQLVPGRGFPLKCGPWISSFDGHHLGTCGTCRILPSCRHKILCTGESGRGFVGRRHPG